MKTKLYRSLLLVGCMGLFAACSTQQQEVGDESIPVLSLTEDTVTMTVGSTHRLSPVNTMSGIEWTSSADSVATVDYIGVVTAQRVGQTWVVASRMNRADSCVVIVTE